MNGVGDKVNGFFDKRQLPMYKDKPYSYAASRRQKSLFKRKRVIFVAISLFLCLVYWITFASSSSELPKTVKNNGASAWNWVKKPSGATVDWDERRQRVKEAFILSWDGYEQYAWGMCSRIRRSSLGLDCCLLHENDQDPDEPMN